jgi:hypothetical protein
LVILFYGFSKPSGGGRALKLGGKKDVESFVDQLKSEGERKYLVQIQILNLLNCETIELSKKFYI